MPTQQVTYWLERVQNNDDLWLAHHALGHLTGYQPPLQAKDLQNLLDLFTAIRIDQMAKEAP